MSKKTVFGDSNNGMLKCKEYLTVYDIAGTVINVMATNVMGTYQPVRILAAYMRLCCSHMRNMFSCGLIGLLVSIVTSVFLTRLDITGLKMRHCSILLCAGCLANLIPKFYYRYVAQLSLYKRDSFC